MKPTSNTLERPASESNETDGAGESTLERDNGGEGQGPDGGEETTADQPEADPDAGHKAFATAALKLMVPAMLQVLVAICKTSNLPGNRAYAASDVAGFMAGERTGGSYKNRYDEVPREVKRKMDRAAGAVRALAAEYSRLLESTKTDNLEEEDQALKDIIG